MKDQIEILLQGILAEALASNPNEENIAKLLLLVRLSEKIDKEPWLIDVQCAEDEELVNQWRQAYQYFTKKPNL
jgi:hypothetical protein